MKCNIMMLIGRLGRDAEVRTLPSGSTVLSFSMATDEGYKDKKTGEWVKKSEWTDVSYFTTDKAAAYLAPLLTKGAEVFVKGKKETRTYDKDGITRYAVQCNADTVEPGNHGGGQKTQYDQGGYDSGLGYGDPTADAPY